MKKINIAVIGAGQSGIQLSLHLLKTNQFNVTLFSKYTAHQILHGRILSSQVMFHDALEKERAIGLNFWDTECPSTNTFSCAVANLHDAKPKIYWESKTQPFQSIDQRLKFSRWLTEFQKLGGNLVIKEVYFHDLASISSENELVIVATGKNSLSEKFEIDQNRSKFTSSQRILVCLYVQGLYPRSTGVRANIIPSIGEFFTTPGFSITGPCEMMLFEGIPDGPWDCWQNLSSPHDLLKQAIRLLKEYIPWESERCHNIKLCDDNATLFGKITPVIRKPIINIPNAKPILGIADAVILNDPIAGQGANHAAKVAYHIADHIIQKQDHIFDKNWMEEVAEDTWQKYSKSATELSNLLLSPPAYLLNTISRASHDNEVAAKLAEGFNNPGSLNWLFSMK